MHDSITPLSHHAYFPRLVKTLKSKHGVSVLMFFVVIAAALSGCGGGGSTDTANNTLQNDGATNFHAFANAKEINAGAESLAALSEAEQAEAATLSRQWAANKLAPIGDGLISNDAVIPPLYFARMQAVAAAASGTTLEQLRKSFPAASSPAVAAALMRGITRTIDAGTNIQFTADFLKDITASSQGKTWEKLVFTQLTDADLAAEANLRMRIVDQFWTTTKWPAVSTYDGVFETDNGSRVSAPMMKVSGEIRSVVDNDMDALALALPQQRWLVRITPKKGLKSWNADALNAAIAKSAKGMAAQTGQVTVTGNFVLPVLSISPDTLVNNDNLGMTSEAQDPINADLRRLDGHGGTYVSGLLGYAQIALSEIGLEINGRSHFSFIFSPDNRFSYGVGESLTSSTNWYSVPCGESEFKPSYLVVVNTIGAVDMLARIGSLGGIPCNKASML